MREEARDWYEGALRDLEMAEVAAGRGMFNWALFAAHQATEKALKTYIMIYKRERPPRTHDLVELLRLSEMDVEEKLAVIISELSPYYSTSRYPNAGLRRPWQSINRETATRMLDAAKALVKKVGEEAGLTSKSS